MRILFLVLSVLKVTFSYIRLGCDGDEWIDNSCVSYKYCYDSDDGQV